MYIEYIINLIIILILWNIIIKRKNYILIFIFIELIFIIIISLFIFKSILYDTHLGFLWALFIITIAASESALGLSILIKYLLVT